MTKTPVKSPAFARREHATEGIALAQSRAAFRGVEQNGSNLGPRALKQAGPLIEVCTGRRSPPERTPRARHCDRLMFRIRVNPARDRTGEFQTARVDLLMRFHT
jgi:hypothetical protein